MYNGAIDMRDTITLLLILFGMILVLLILGLTLPYRGV